MLGLAWPARGPAQPIPSPASPRRPEPFMCWELPRVGYVGRSRAAGLAAPMRAVADTTDHSAVLRKIAAGAQGQKVGVLLLNLGGPEKLDDVQPFLYNLFADPDIIRLPAALQGLQKPIATAISLARAPKVRVGRRLGSRRGARDAGCCAAGRP